jgi:SHS2 domain-containing protein
MSEPGAFEGMEATPTTLRVHARGTTLEEAPSLVKAATMHKLRLTEGGMIQADVVLDV